MKKIILVLFIFMFSFSFFDLQVVFAESEKTTYFARLINSNIYLLSSPLSLTDNSNFVCTLPQTYFVKVVDEENDFYKVEYMDLSGYIKKEDISFISGEPISPYCNNLSFRVFAENGIRLRSEPNTITGVIRCTLPFMEDNIIFYGNRIGEESIIYKGNVWYYCKYLKNDEVYNGYVYSAFCDLLTEIKPNTEQFEYIEAPSFEVVESGGKITEIDKLDSTTKVLLISLCSLPCLVIIYLLFKPTKIATETVSANKTTNSLNLGTRKKRKKKIKHLKRSDYYELD